MGFKSRIPPELIERFRQTGIRLDREGNFWHEGAVVEHQGLQRALLRWLDVRDDGRPILRLDENRYAYVDVDDAHLLVRSLQWDGERAWLLLNDGTREELDYGTLHVGRGHALYCRVRGGKLLARITQPAYYVLAERIEERGRDFGLTVGGRFFVVEASEGQSQAEASAP